MHHKGIIDWSDVELPEVDSRIWNHALKLVDEAVVRIYDLPILLILRIFEEVGEALIRI